ncbi:MAG TPA: hypothetical protein VHY48_06440 [Acidobacteriaceae bacterium]|jgi:hypothetical protein|nr:hypothetical protein [Acidobacteriaceae bacterium]
MATLAATPAFLSAQATQSTGPAANITQSQPAPIEHAYPSTPDQGTYANQYPAPPPQTRRNQGFPNTQPAPGVYLRVGHRSHVETVSATAERTELRVQRGVANINVHDPAKNSIILVDMPNGQVQLLKNGLYTFNASTDTARVLKGEARAFPASAPATKPIKVKGDHQISFVGTNIRSTGFDPYEASADLLPSPAAATNGEYGPYGNTYPGYGDGFYYGYPYFAYGYGYPYGYPWGWGYPYGVGLGFGYYGGFHGGGFHGGGFHGGGFHGGHR